MDSRLINLELYDYKIKKISVLFDYEHVLNPRLTKSFQVIFFLDDDRLTGWNGDTINEKLIIQHSKSVLKLSKCVFQGTYHTKDGSISVGLEKKILTEILAWLSVPPDTKINAEDGSVNLNQTLRALKEVTETVETKDNAELIEKISDFGADFEGDLKLTWGIIQPRLINYLKTIYESRRQSKN